jgi:hypothetical protein
MSKIIEDLKRQVIEYHNSHKELQQAHHFDFAIQHSNQIDYFLFGINPGETEEDKKLFPGIGHFNPYDPTQTAIEKFSKSARSYASFAKEICGSSNFLISEFFFWSSKDVVQLKSRYGGSLN